MQILKFSVLTLLLCWTFGFSASLSAATTNQQAASKKLAQRIALLITGLTDSRERMHRRAIDGLIAIGAPVLPDLKILYRDEDPTMRLRVAMVLTRINDPQATQMLIELSKDQEATIREVSSLGLGSKKGDDALRRLAVLLNDEVPAVRESAAIAIGFMDDSRGIRLLAHSYVSELIPETLMADEERHIRRAKSAKYSALKSLAKRPQHINAVAHYCNLLEGPALHALLKITFEIANPRLCPGLVKVLDRDVDLEAMALAARSLSANGDSRCIEKLCQIAAGKNGPRAEAAKTLSVLTGHQAGQGSSWSLWWRDHQEKIQRIIKRDTFIAQIYDPTNIPTTADLQRFTVIELSDLLDGALSQRGTYWPKLAYRAIKADDPQRWTQYLLKAHATETDEVRRIGMLLLLNEIADDAARAVLKQRFVEMDRTLKQALDMGADAQAFNSERSVLALFNK